MTTRKRLVSLVGAAALATSSLLAVGAAPVANAATPVCEGLVVAQNAGTNMLYRSWEGAAITKEKQSAPLDVQYQYLVYHGSRALGGGVTSSVYGAFRYDQTAPIFDVVNKSTSPTLSVKYLRKYNQRFEGRLVTTGSGFSVYAVDNNGNLRRYTRYLDQDNRLYLGGAKTVTKYMSGLRTLAYFWTIKLDGVYQDVLYGTTASGKLLQFRIPTANPSAEKIVKLADTGFGSYEWLSLGACNNTGHYLAILALDKETDSARLYTLPSQTVPKTYNLAERGLVGVGADWNLHAVS